VLDFAAGTVQAMNSSSVQLTGMKLTAPWGNSLTQIAKQRGAEDGMQVFATEVLPGNQEIVFKIAQGENLGDSSAGMEEAQGASNAVSKLPVLSLPQAGTLAKQVAELAAIVKEAKRDLGAAAGTIKQLAQLAQKYAGQQGEGNEGAETTKHAILGIKKALEEPLKEFNIYALRTGNAALTWVEASLKQYGAKAAAPAAAGGEAPVKA
jgi:hypothetical protein